MAVSNFIPAVWSQRILERLETSLVFAREDVANRNWEGEIKGKGSSVKINALGEVTVKSYSRNTDIDAPDQLDSSQTVLLIDTEEYVNIAVDDVDYAQASPKYMDEAIDSIAYGLRKKLDTYMALKMATEVASGNIIANSGAAYVPVAGSAGAGEINAYDALVDLSVKLDQNDTPDDGKRWVIVTPAYHGLLLKDDRFISGSDSARAVLGSGFVGEAAGMRIFKSNQVRLNATPTPDEYSIVAGHPMAATVAQQIVSMEAYRPERRFADAVKGLHVYGGKVIRPSNIAVLLSTK